MTMNMDAINQVAGADIPADRCLTLAVTSGKGGVGKSSLSVNLALRLGAAGKKIIVLDADLGLANLDVLFGIRPHHTLWHVLQGKKRLLDIVQPINRNVRLIAGGSGIANLADLPTESRMDFLRSLAQLRQYADVMLIDTGAGLSSNVIEFLNYADEVLLISTPEPTAMADAYGVVKTLARNSEEFPKVSVVVNRVASAAEAQGVSSRLISVARQFLNVEVGYKGYVLDDPNVSKAVRAQKPFTEVYPDSRASLCLSRLAESYGAQQPLRKPQSGQSFLNTLVGLMTGKR